MVEAPQLLAGLESVNLIDWTPHAFVGLIVLLILTDRLVLRIRLTEERQNTTKFEDAYKEEKNSHRLTIKAYNDTVKSTLDTLLTGQQTTNNILNGLRQRAGEKDEGDFFAKD